MKLKTKIALVLTFTLLVLTPIASAHIPRTAEENESLDTAKFIEDTVTSWAIYSELRDPEIANYYRMEMESGDRLYFNLFLKNQSGFVPNLVIMGPGIDSNDSVPEFIETPEEGGIKLIEGEAQEKEYEAFTPSSYYQTAEFDEQINESGTYHLAVFSEDEKIGNYGLAIGYEENWGAIEWIKLPLDIITVRLWEGQSLWLIFAPMIAVFGLGFGITGWKHYKKEKAINNPKEFSLLVASFLYFGSGAMVFMQMLIAGSQSNPGLEILPTIFLFTLPWILGYLLWKRSTHFKDPEKKERIKVLSMGILGLVFQMGLVLGPIITVLVALLPSKWL